MFKKTLVSCLCVMFFRLRLSDKVIRHRASSLKDTAHAIFASELDPEFGRMCDEIKESWRKRGEEKVKRSQVLERKPAANLNIYQTDIYMYIYMLNMLNMRSAITAPLIFHAAYSFCLLPRAFLFTHAHFHLRFFRLITDALRHTAPSHGGVEQLRSVHLFRNSP